jgi:hypothetical protein
MSSSLTWMVPIRILAIVGSEVMLTVISPSSYSGPTFERAMGSETELHKKKS